MKITTMIVAGTLLSLAPGIAETPKGWPQSVEAIKC